MYTINRRKKLNETVRFQNGDAVLDVFVDLDVDSMFGEFNRAYNTLAAAESTLRAASVSQENLTENEEKYGKAMVDILRVVFGDEQTQKMLDFYENRYIELLEDIYPFLLNVVTPAIKKSADEKKARIKKETQRRGIFKR